MTIAWAVWRTGSIWVGALMHLVNNGTIVLVASVPVLRELFADPEAPPPLWLVPVAGILFVTGLRILLRPTVPDAPLPTPLDPEP
jgi:hypothetical protein